ncbi:MAG: hypothetical protein ACKE5M_01180 [Methylophilaceae bacterium]
MSFLAKLTKKIGTLFAAPTKSAAQVWQEVGGEAKHPFWLYAAPVNMMLGRDSFFLSEPAPLPMTNDESLAIIASLNQHFSQDGYYFYLQEGIWFLGLDTDPNMTTTDVNQVLNKDVASYQPKGGGSLAWAALQNEIQMLLFNHPVNDQREAQGQPIMNSLWCYGLGASA